MDDFDKIYTRVYEKKELGKGARAWSTFPRADPMTLLVYRQLARRKESAGTLDTLHHIRCAHYGTVFDMVWRQMRRVVSRSNHHLASVVDDFLF